VRADLLVSSQSPVVHVPDSMVREASHLQRRLEMAQKHGSLGGLAILFMLGCSLDGGHIDGGTPLPLSITPVGAGVSFVFATLPNPGEGVPRVAGENDRPMPLQTAGGPNLVTASPQISSFDFGLTPVGTFQQVTWTILNIGDAASGTLGINSSNGVDFDASDSFCQSLAPLEDCSLTITYLPQSLGPHSSTFSVTGFPITYTFSGTGRPPFGAENP
jgi:hypothetical protein